MTTTPRDIPTVDIDAPLQHVALLYESPERLREVAGEFLSGAAAAGEPVLALLPAAHLELLDAPLTAPGLHVETVDVAREGRNPARVIPLQQEFVDRHPGRTRIISESLFVGRSAPEATECLRLDALLNHALADAPVDVLCPFDAARLDAEHLRGAELAHPRLIDHDGLRASRAYGDPLDVAGGRHWPQPEPPDPADFEFDGDLRALRRALLDDPAFDELPSHRRDDFVFAINEAATNAIRHGDGQAQVRLWREGAAVVCEVRTPTTIDDPLAGLRRPGPDATRGRGLWLMHQVCDLVEIRSDGGEASVRLHVAAA